VVPMGRLAAGANAVHVSPAVRVPHLGQGALTRQAAEEVCVGKEVAAESAGASAWGGSERSE
jgi:hypothetical protein